MNLVSFIGQLEKRPWIIAVIFQVFNSMSNGFSEPLK
jgi:hypothetical protein